MDYDLEATVDICFKINQFRNLNTIYLRSLFFQLSATAGDYQASPYQIISDNNNPSSITLFQYVSPLYSFGPLAKADLSELAVFRVNIPFKDIDHSPLTCKFTLFQVNAHQKQTVLDEIFVFHSSLLWINSYCPVFFMENYCAIDLAVQTQLLKYRVRQINSAPEISLKTSVEQLLVSYNKLKNKVSISDFDQNEEFREELMADLGEAMKQSKLKIFETEIKKSKQKLIEVAQRYLPQIGDLLMQNWSSYLKQIKNKDIQEERLSYINSLSLIVKEKVYQNNLELALNPQKSELLVQSIKLKPIPLSITELQKHEVQKNSIKSINHFVFLVHGYGATRSATKQLQLTLRYLFPHLIIVSSQINEDKTEDCLSHMGKRLAAEVEMSISNHKCGSNYSISFIAHSLGGLIVRSALTFMQQQRYNMKNFISLGTPHLGHLFHNSSINRFGMWTLAKLRKSEVMSTLLLQTEEGDYRKSYLYELSLVSGLSWFEQIAFYGCNGDKFVSLESAVCLGSPDIENQQKEGNEQACVWQQMRRNISNLIRDVGVTKYQVDFSLLNEKAQSTFTDDWLGRRDHLNLLSSQTFIQCMLASSKNLFL